MKDRKTTLTRIAEILGTSKISVSRALKGQSGVSESLRAEVRRLAAELGYGYERLRLPEKKICVVFLTPKRFYLTTDSFYHVIYYHLNTLCTGNNMSLSVGILEREAEEQGLLPGGVASADGIIIGGEIAGPALEAIAGLGVPFVSVDHNIVDPGGIADAADCVVMENYLVGSMAAEYLYKRGCRRIGFVGSHRQSSNVSDRIYGFLKVIGRRALPFREDWLISNYDFAADNYTLNISLPPEMPEAFICHCDRAAYHFIEKLRSEGCRVPADIGILSIDNTDLAAACSPRLTSVNIDKRRLAEEAFRLLKRRLEGETTAQRVYVNTEIVERESVRTVRGVP